MMLIMTKSMCVIMSEPRHKVTRLRPRARVLPVVVAPSVASVPKGRKGSDVLSVTTRSALMALQQRYSALYGDVAGIATFYGTRGWIPEIKRALVPCAQASAYKAVITALGALVTALESDYSTFIACAYTQGEALEKLIPAQDNAYGVAFYNAIDPVCEEIMQLLKRK